MKARTTTGKLKAAFKEFQKLPVLPLAAKQFRLPLEEHWLADRAGELSLPPLPTPGFQLQPALK
jgi:hypothetical protein